MTMQGCQYRKDDWQCPESVCVWGGNHCIFHTNSTHKDAGILAKRLDWRLSEANKEEDPVRFDGAIFPQADIYRRIYNRSVSFADAKFESVDFEGAEFSGEITSFKGVQIGGSASFKETKFSSKKIIFKSAQLKSANFEKANFSPTIPIEEIDFSLCQFQNSCFDKARFNSNIISFVRATFMDRVSFKDTEFRSKEISFESARFVPFMAGARPGEFIFRGKEPDGLFLEGSVNFKKVSIADKVAFTFEWVNLSQTEFLETDISRIKFMDVEWYKQYDFLKIFGAWRSKLYDEQIWRKSRKNAVVDYHYLTQFSRLYRTLKDYYLKTGEIQLYGHFHYGYMEVLLRQEKQKIQKVWRYLYKLTSGYGEDFALAGAILLVLIFSFAGIYAILEIPTKYPSCLAQFFNSLLYSFQEGTLSRLAFYQEADMGLCAKFLYLAESILVPAKFEFFIMALRNRFRR